MVHATVVDVADLAVRLAARRAELGVPDLPATPAPAAPRLSGRCSRLSRISAASGEGRLPPRTPPVTPAQAGAYRALPGHPAIAGAPATAPPCAKVTVMDPGLRRGDEGRGYRGSRRQVVRGGCRHATPIARSRPPRARRRSSRSTCAALSSTCSTYSSISPTITSMR